jgi:hypothetical protein
MRFNREFGSNVRDESEWQDEKHEEQKILTLDGIIIDRIVELAKACDSIRVKHEWDSNEIDESKQLRKHEEQKISIVHGIVIDSSDALENTCDSIRVSREFDSNKTDESE